MSLLTKGRELSNQDKIRMLREKETYKYLGILEADTFKQAEMKEKRKKNSSVSFGLVLWHINHCRLFYAKSILIDINSSISNNAV